MESNPYHTTSIKTPSHTHITWLNSQSPQLSHLISYTEPTKYGELNTRINSLACKSPVPLTYVTQQFGREVCFTNGSSGLAAISLLGSGPMPKSSPTTSIDDTLHQTTACTNTEAIRRLNEETSRAHATTLRMQALQTPVAHKDYHIVVCS